MKSRAQGPAEYGLSGQSGIGQQNLVNGMDYAIGGHNICDNYIGSAAIPVTPNGWTRQADAYSLRRQ